MGNPEIIIKLPLVAVHMATWIMAGTWALCLLVYAARDIRRKIEDRRIAIAMREAGR